LSRRRAAAEGQWAQALIKNLDEKKVRDALAISASFFISGAM
jgi:hypothetical protein